MASQKEGGEAQARWPATSSDAALRILGSSRSGLSSIEANSRLGRYGPNEIIEKKAKSDLAIFIDQFNNFLILILLVAVVISAAVGESVNAAVILAIVILDAILGYLQVKKAEAAISALKKIAVPNVKVIRDSQVRTIISRELVPGDVIILGVGDKVPADCRILQQMNLRTDESLLTGESAPVSKDERTHSSQAERRKNMLFSGTTITYGRCEALVVLTGMSTEFGKIAETIQQPEEETLLQKKVNILGRQLGIIFVAASFAVFVVGVLASIPLVTMFITAIALAVAAVPEGLPASITIALAIGIGRMANRKAIVRRLAAVEGLGSVTVICSDKTGTLTVNEMTVRRIWTLDSELEVTGEGYRAPGRFLVSGKPSSIAMRGAAAKVLKAGLLCNDAFADSEFVGDPTELALIISARKAGLKEDLRSLTRLGEFPFDSGRRMMSVIYDTQDEDGRSLWAKGATEEILRRCSFVMKGGKTKRLTESDRKKILESNKAYAAKSLRVLSFAVKHVAARTPATESGMMFLGMQAMMDPPRPEAKGAITRCQAAGIKVIMVTGDHKETASAVAHELGLIDGGHVLTGEELDKLSDSEFDKVVAGINVYARTSPEHKVRITEALKRMGEVVAVTGDGVNDAPALRKAAIGVAMGITGTDVAREVSDMVIADDNFATIVAAIEEGRGIYDNIRKTIAFLLSTNIAEIMILLLAVVTYLPLPLIAIQLLWINLVINGLPALALAVDPISHDVMRRKPRPPSESLTDNMKLFLADAPVLMTVAVLGLFLLTLHDGGSLVRAQTVASTTIILMAFAYALSCRSLERPVGTGIFENKYLILTMVVSLLLHAVILYTTPLQQMFQMGPLTAEEWLAITSVSLASFLYLEGAKMFSHAKKSAAVTEKTVA